MIVLLLAPAVAVVQQPAELLLLFPDGVGKGASVQMSDGGAGGTFVPPVVTPQAGDDRAVVMYTPSRDGPIQISTTPTSTCCLPAQWRGQNLFAAVSSDGLTLTLTAASPPYGFLLINGGNGFLRGVYRVAHIHDAIVELERPCARGIVNVAEIEGALLTVAYTGAFTMQAQRFWPTARPTGGVVDRADWVTVVITGRRSNLFYLGEPITLRARKGTVVTRYEVRDLQGSMVAAGPMNPSEFYDAAVTIHLDRCGYYLVDYFGEAVDFVYGSCAASAPLVVTQRSTGGLMDRPAYASIHGDFSPTPMKTAVGLMQWIVPPGRADHPWYAVATGQIASRRTGTYLFRIVSAAGGCRLTIAGRLLLDCMNDPTFGSVVVSDPVTLRAGERFDVVYECAGIDAAHRQIIDMSLDGGSSWQRFVIDQYPTKKSTVGAGLTIQYLKLLFPFRPRPGFDLFTGAACGLGIERLCVFNSSNPGPECDAWEPLIDAWLARCGADSPRRNRIFLQFTNYRSATVLIQAAVEGALELSVSTNLFGPGGVLRIGEETHHVRSVQNGTVVLATPLAQNYAVGALVRHDPPAEDAAVAATVRRFGGKVQIWECTNEPDGVRPAIEHVGYMRSFYAAVKAGAPGSASIVLGPTTTGCNRELNPGGYVDLIARNGGLAFVDGFAFHAYNQVDGEYLEACKGMEKIRSFLAAHDASHLPLYQTEQGVQTDIFGVLEPWHQINWTLAQRLAFDRYGLPLERDYFWTTADHGDPAFAMHLITTFGLLTPAWLLLRTYSDALAGATFADSYDLGSAEGLFVASRYVQGERVVAVFWSPGNPEGSLDLDVIGGDALEMRDGWGNRRVLPVVGGRVTLSELAVPAYLVLAPGQAVTPVRQNWGPNLALAARASGNGTTTDAAWVNNDVIEFLYFDGTPPFLEKGSASTGAVMPVEVTLRWPEPQMIGRLVIHCPAPWQGYGALQQYDVLFQDGGGNWQTLVPLVTQLPRAEAILQPGFNAIARDFWDRRHVFHHVLSTPVRCASIRLRIFAASWGGEASQLSVEAGGMGFSMVWPAISEWQVYGPSSAWADPAATGSRRLR